MRSLVMVIRQDGPRARVEGDTIHWFWIGSHSEYDGWID
jgi:hypothetical protein